MPKFRIGDEVEIYDYGIGYDGLSGEVTGVEDAILHFRNKVQTKHYRAGMNISMYTRNCRLVDNAASFIPEDWS